MFQVAVYCSCASHIMDVAEGSPPARFQTFSMELLIEEEQPFESMEMVIAYETTPAN